MDEFVSLRTTGGHFHDNLLKRIGITVSIRDFTRLYHEILILAQWQQGTDVEIQMLEQDMSPEQYDYHVIEPLRSDRPQHMEDGCKVKLKFFLGNKTFAKQGPRLERLQHHPLYISWFHGRYRTTTYT